MSDRILVVVGHPLAGSLSHELGLRYAEAARAAGAEVRVRDLSERQPQNPPDRASLRSVREDRSCWSHPWPPTWPIWSGRSTS